MPLRPFSRYTTFCDGGSMNCCSAPALPCAPEKPAGLFQLQRGLFGRQAPPSCRRRSGSYSPPAGHMRSATGRPPAASRPRPPIRSASSMFRDALGSASRTHAAVVDLFYEEINILIRKCPDSDIDASTRPAPGPLVRPRGRSLRARSNIRLYTFANVAIVLIPLSSDDFNRAQFRAAGRQNCP